MTAGTGIVAAWKTVARAWDADSGSVGSGRYGWLWIDGPDAIAGWARPVAADQTGAADRNAAGVTAVTALGPEPHTPYLTLPSSPMLRRCVVFCRRGALLIAISGPLVIAHPLQAQRSIGAEGGFVDARDFTGVTALAFMEAQSLIFFARGAVDLGLGPEDSTVAQEGDTCREIGSGQAVNDSRCTKLDGGLTVRTGVLFPIGARELQLGLGYRFGKSQSGFIGSGSLRFPTGGGWWGLTLEVGDEILRATAGIAWDIGRTQFDDGR